MANQQGFAIEKNAADLKAILGHFDRQKYFDKDGKPKFYRYPNLTQNGSDKRYSTSEIRPELSHLNYNLAPERKGGQLAFIEQRLAEVYVHGTAKKNALVDWVVTLPDLPQYEGREREFFKCCYAWLAEKYGEQNVVSAYVHMDEVQPHMHFAFLPIVPDLKHVQGEKLSRKAVNTCPELDKATLQPKLGKDGKPKMNTVSFSLTLHLELNAYVEKQMGLEVGGIRLTEQQQEKRVIKENMRGPVELKQATKAKLEMDAQKEDAEQKLADIKEQQAAEVAKLQGLQGDVAEKAGQIEEIDAKISEKRAEKAKIEAEIAAFAEKRDALRQEVTALEKLKDALAEWLAAPPANELTAKLRYLTAELIERFGKPQAQEIVVAAQAKYELRMAAKLKPQGADAGAPVDAPAKLRARAQKLGRPPRL